MNKKTSLEGKSKWIGYYQYEDLNRDGVIGVFIMNLSVDKKGVVTGECDEPRTDFGPEALMTLHSTIKDGNYNKLLNHIAFDKVYGYDGHSVYYSGVLDGNQIVGEWYIGGYTGYWKISKM